MKKRLLAMLLALMLVVGLLPVGVLADDTGGTREITSYVTPSYNSDAGSPGSGELKTIHVVVRSSDDGSVLQKDNWDSVWSTNNIITVNLTSEASSIYDIESASIDRGTNTDWSYGNKKIQFRWTYNMYNEEIATLTIYLCPEYEAPDFPKGEIDTGATIEYIAYEPALLKLLYVNGVTGVDEHTEINGVEFNFVQNYTGDDFNFTPVGTGANNLMYYTAVLSDVADRGNPRNIRSIDISYTPGDGTEETLRVYSGDLRYIKIDADTYEIEANNDDTSIVAFYNQPGAQYSTWSLYDVKFVNTGDALGDENMPETPTYPDTEYDFTNWDKNVGGGSPFLPNEEIDDDTVVYAMKTSSSIGGTEFHVMNTNNVLLDRIVEKYNAENNTEYGISDIVLDSVRIQVNGADNESTNPNYFSNRWESPGNPYYHVNNGGIVGSNEIYSNTHIPHDEVRSITVFATTTDGKNIEVNIPRSNNCGDVSISLVQDNIVEIIISAPPEKPSDDDLYVDPDEPDDTGLLASAVKVTCTNTDAEHNAKTFDLLPGSFSIGDVVYTTEGYTCTVTVNADAYVTAYSIKNGTHALAEDESSTKTIKLVYSDNSWTVPTDATPVNFNVTCDTEGPEEPTVPEKPGEADLGNLSVTLNCVTANVEHEEGVFKLESSNCTVADVVASADGVYTCVVTPDYASILAAYNKNVGVTHTYTDDTNPVFTLTWDAESKEWVAVADNTSITRRVQCESTELPDDYVAEYHVMNLYDELDIIAENWGHENYIGFYLNGKDGSTLGTPGDDLSEGNEWNDDRTYYTVNNGTYGSDDYMPYTEVDGLHFYYAITPVAAFTYRDIDILVTKPDENHVSEIYVLFDIRLYNDYNNGYWHDVDGDGKKEHWATTSQSFGSGNGHWKAGSEIALNDTLVNTQGKKYYEPTHADVNGRDVVFLGWDVENHETIYEPGDRPTNLITDAFSITGDVLSNCNITPLEVCLYGVYGYAEPDAPTPGEISDLIKGNVVVDCVNDEMNHGDKAYGLLDDALVRSEQTDDTTVKVTLDATVYQARYNTDTKTKHSLAGGQSATVTFALNYVDQTWRVAEGELPITIKVVCETPVSPAVPEKPSYSDIASLFLSSIQVDCVSKSYHKTGVYGLLTDGYTVSAPVKGSDGKYTCTVTLLANAYLAKYNNSFGYAKHSLASYQGNESVTLKWNEAEEEWNTVYGQLPVTIDVVCKNYIPVLPSLPDVPDDTTPNWLNLDDHDAYIQGYPDGCVKPQNNITRAEVATIFFRLLTDDARDYYYSTDSGFSDVNPGDWYNTAVATMVQAGILNGYSDGTFKPNASITRAEFATIAARFLSNPYSTKDRFYDTEGHWAEVYINRAAEIGWIGGYPDGSFKPDQYITRAEAVTLVNNVLGREPHADYMLDDMIRWPDNPKSAWYYEDIQEATNSHDYRWSSSKSYEIWTKLL